MITTGAIRKSSTAPAKARDGHDAGPRPLSVFGHHAQGADHPRPSKMRSRRTMRL
jgi:hypothetical protein